MQLATHILLPESSKKGPAQQPWNCESVSTTEGEPRRRESSRRPRRPFQAWRNTSLQCRAQPAKRGGFLGYLLSQLFDALLTSAGSMLGSLCCDRFWPPGHLPSGEPASKPWPQTTGWQQASRQILHLPIGMIIEIEQNHQDVSALFLAVVKQGTLWENCFTKSDLVELCEITKGLFRLWRVWKANPCRGGKLPLLNYKSTMSACKYRGSISCIQCTARIQPIHYLIVSFFLHVWLKLKKSDPESVSPIRHTQPAVLLCGRVSVAI